MIELAAITTGGIVGLWAAWRYTDEDLVDLKRQWRERNMDPEFKKFQRLLSSDPNSPDGGEVMVRFDSGKSVPFHEHDTTIHDEDLLIEKEAADGVVWYSARKIEAVWLHKEHLDVL